jgi:galactoside O-acetyltransferase
MSFLTQMQLEQLNFRYIGKNVKISDKSSIYNPQNIYLGDNSRVDDFCILSAGKSGIHIGRYVHVAAYSSLIGAEQIYLDDFSGISSRVSIYSSNDDYSGEFMAHPTIPDLLRSVESSPVLLEKHTIIGAGSIVLPGARLLCGAAIGAFSLVTGKEYPGFVIYGGIPAKEIKKRKSSLLELEKKLIVKE